MTQNQKKSKDLKEIILNDDSNLILPEVSFPTSYDTQGVDKVKLGAKSTAQKQASEHDLLLYQQRLSRKDATLTPDEIKTLVYETNQRRTALEESIRQQKQEYMQRHDLEIQARRAKEQEEARANRIAHENDTQRQMRLDAEEEVKTQRAKEIQSLENKRRKEKEEVETFFLQSSNRFNEKYGYATKKISGETGIDRIVSSRTFSTNRYAHRCVVCRYHNPESLSISKIYTHIFENKDTHMQFTINEIDNYYNNSITETRRKHAAEDNPDLRQIKLSDELKQLQKLKGAKYR